MYLKISWKLSVLVHRGKEFQKSNTGHLMPFPDRRINQVPSHIKALMTLAGFCGTETLNPWLREYGGSNWRVITIRALAAYRHRPRLFQGDTVRTDSKSKSKLLYDLRSVSQSVCLGIEHTCGTCDQILLPIGMLLSEICDLLSVGALCDERTGLQFAV
jgi:hypothetical protein